MNSPKETKENSDFNIFVTFNIPDDFNNTSSAARVTRFLDEEFGELQTKVIDVHSEEYREITFKIQRPLLKTQEVQYDFFDKLAEIFAATSQYNPHFTQLSPELSRGNLAK